MKPETKKMSPEKFDKLDIVFGTNGPHVSELTPEDWFKIINHAIRISEEHLKNLPDFKEISKLKKNDLLEIIKRNPYWGRRMLNNLADLLSKEALAKFAEIKHIFAIEAEIIGLKAATREDIEIIRK